MSRFHNGSKWIWPATRKRIYARDGWACVHCGSMPVQLTLDHIRPRALGGSNRPTNLVTSCLSCNSSRGVTMLPPADHARLRALARRRLPAAVSC